jgi:hypothetical protein
MKTAMHGKILAIAAAAMIGMAATDDAALARGSGGFGGGHIGGFGGAHVGVVAGPRVGDFGVGRMGGLGVRLMAMPGLAMDRGLGDSGIGTLVCRMNWDTTISAVSTARRLSTKQTIAHGRLI